MATYQKGKKKIFSPSDLAFRRMDPHARFSWELDIENYNRYEGLDWWLEFGFPDFLITFRKLECLYEI